MVWDRHGMDARGRVLERVQHASRILRCEAREDQVQRLVVLPLPLGVAGDLSCCGWVMAAVEPDLAIPDQWPGRKVLKPRRPLRAPHGRIERRRGNMKLVLVAQHRD